MSLSNLHIRSIHPDDIPGLHTILNHPQVIETGLNLYAKEYSDTQEDFQKSKSGLHRLVGILDDPDFWGQGIGTQMAEKLIDLMVHPDYWSIGIGSRLMEAILDTADNWLDLKRVNLEVNTDNPAAIHLYQKFGFEIEGTHRFHAYGNGRWADSHFMARLRGDMTR